MRKEPLNSEEYDEFIALLNKLALEEQGKLEMSKDEFKRLEELVDREALTL